jgi:thiosulfate/3-mercaptopyruvate sulfurtransferase
MSYCRSVLVSALTALAAGAGPVQAAPEAYPNAALLVETEWVAAHGSDAGIRLVDMRPADAYVASHLPGAVQVEERLLRDAADSATYLPKPEALAAMMGRAGIGNDTRVVIYDDQGGKAAARLWYVLNAYGHDRVSLVNGGWNKWIAEARPVSRTVAPVATVTFTPTRTPTLTCPAAEVLTRRPGVVVLDTRAPAEFRGEQTSPGAKRAGRIPGAVNIEWKENVTGPNLVFKPAADLRQLYESRGVTPEKEIVTHCAGGGRAAQTLFTLKLLGYPKVRIYYGSFADYSARPEAPVER